MSVDTTRVPWRVEVHYENSPEFDGAYETFDTLLRMADRAIAPATFTPSQPTDGTDPIDDEAFPLDVEW